VKLTREERARILAGDHSALKRRDRPECSEGDIVVLIWSRAQTMITDRATGETIDYPRRPLFWVELGEPIRHRDGGWIVGLKVNDERTTTRFLAPSGSPAAESLTDETAKGYQSTAAGAIDDQEAVDAQELERQKVKSRERWAQHRRELAEEEEARRQERALREQLREAARSLPPTASQALFAAVERQIRAALKGENSTAA